MSKADHLFTVNTNSARESVLKKGLFLKIGEPEDRSDCNSTEPQNRQERNERSTFTKTTLANGRYGVETRSAVVIIIKKINDLSASSSILQGFGQIWVDFRSFQNVRRGVRIMLCTGEFDQGQAFIHLRKVTPRCVGRAVRKLSSEMEIPKNLINFEARNQPFSRELSLLALEDKQCWV
ncbi:hypothetical protein Tco_0720401 [Tanacetum coccineum]|uniref:Uncharacterized protein n=1 Tax=Tanacetum coccineum TaxID=301880 RepID=A0ABQ5CQP0_9ASTR